MHFRERDVEAWLAEQTIGASPAPKRAAQQAAATADRAEMCRALGIESDHLFS